MNKNDPTGDLAAPNLIVKDETQYPGTFPSSQLDGYTLTIGEACSLMYAERCKFASKRKMQRMCRDGVLDCHMLRTTRNGQPVSEWLVNETSLRTHIAENEIKWSDGSVIPPPATGNASLPPIRSGDVSNTNVPSKSPSFRGDAVAMPNQSGDADGGAEKAKSQSSKADVMTSPLDDGDAFGETRSLASVLIENAKLTAELEGTRDLIGEIKLDKDFLKEELKEARAGRKDVTAIAQRMLETLETIAIGGKLRHEDANRNPPPSSISVHHEIPKPPTGDNRPSSTSQYEV